MKEIKLKPNYYSVTPATVRYDPNLKPMEKLLYGELSALSNKEGFSWVTNGYLADLYDVTKETVSRWISNLAKNQYIMVEHISDYEETSQNMRKIFILDLIQNQYPLDKKINTPLDKKINHNNTSNNNTSKKKNKEKFSLNNLNEKDQLLIDNYCSSDKNHWADYSDFYKEELLKSLIDGNRYYRIVLEILYGENETSKPLEAVLTIKNQISYAEFLKLEEYKLSNRFSYNDLLLRMENYKDTSKKYTSLYLTIRNWAKSK